MPQIAKQQQQLIQQQHKINMLQQQIQVGSRRRRRRTRPAPLSRLTRVCPVLPQQVNMPYVMIPAFHPSTQPLPVTSEPQMALPLQPIPCKPGENAGSRVRTLAVTPEPPGRPEPLNVQSRSSEAGLLGEGSEKVLSGRAASEPWSPQGRRRIEAPGERRRPRRYQKEPVNPVSSATIWKHLHLRFKLSSAFRQQKGLR